jgi:hypothetical protein
MAMIVTYTSLLPTLQPPEHIVALEEAIIAGRLGHFDEAEAIFEQRLPPSHTLPIIALERSKVYETQGLHFKSVNLLRKALDWNDDAGHERWLMRISHRNGEFYVHGALFNALEEARKVRSLLMDVPFEQYTDIDVRSVSLRCACYTTELAKFGR